MIKVNYDEYSLLANLGVSFDQKLNLEFTPEESLINLITKFNIIENRRLLSLLLVAFNNLQDYFRPDLLAHLAKEISSKDKRILGGVIFRRSLNKPARWNCVLKVINNVKLSKKGRIAISSPELINARGADEYFNNFKIQITPVAKSSNKKLVKNEFILSRNYWFVNRIMFGTSSRADIYTIRENHLESTPYRVAKRFNCSIPSITKIWNDIVFAQHLKYSLKEL